MTPDSKEVLNFVFQFVFTLGRGISVQKMNALNEVMEILTSFFFPPFG